MLAAYGAEGIALYAVNRAETAMVLTDMAMPVIDAPGDDHAIRAIESRARIIDSSKLSSTGSVAKAVGAPVDGTISKPYTAEVLLGALRDVLRAPPRGANTAALAL
jgi:DNA-binding NarL/FixJ family response regulator